MDDALANLTTLDVLLEISNRVGVGNKVEHCVFTRRRYPSDVAMTGGDTVDSRDMEIKTCCLVVDAMDSVALRNAGFGADTDPTREEKAAARDDAVKALMTDYGIDESFAEDILNDSNKNAPIALIMLALNVVARLKAETETRAVTRPRFDRPRLFG